MPTPISALAVVKGTADPLLGSGQAAPTNIKEAARQFESLLIGQMLTLAGESDSSGLGADGESDSETSVVKDLANQQFAQMLSQKGGLGLSRLISGELGKQNKF